MTTKTTPRVQRRGTRVDRNGRVPVVSATWMTEPGEGRAQAQPEDRLMARRPRDGGVPLERELHQFPRCAASWTEHAVHQTGLDRYRATLATMGWTTRSPKKEKAA
jgi:hypothetical protein